MGETAEEFLGALVARPWRPRSLQDTRPEPFSFRFRVAVLLPILLLHLLAGLALRQLLAHRDPPTDESVMVVSFIDQPPQIRRVDAAPAEAPARAPMVPDPAVPRLAPPPIDPRPARHPEKRQLSLTADPIKRESRPIDFYSSDGRVRVPNDMLEQIDRQVGDKRVFSYQVPRMDDAKKLLHRNPPISYQSTRFDKYWKPDQDMLTDLLTQLVEKTTKEIRIPVPGSPGSTMICQVSLLALGGGCGVLTNGADYVGPVDDPDTLDAEEDRQCQAWWQQIIGARTQEIWRRTRDLYEAQCRKPLLQKR